MQGHSIYSISIKYVYAGIILIYNSVYVSVYGVYNVRIQRIHCIRIQRTVYPYTAYYNVSIMRVSFQSGAGTGDSYTEDVILYGYSSCPPLELGKEGTFQI